MQFPNNLHLVVGRSPGHTAEAWLRIARLGCVWHGPLVSRKVRKQKATSIQYLRDLSYLCQFFSQVHKRWLRFLPFWASASSVRPSLPAQSPPSGSSASASPAAPHRARLPCTDVRGRLQLCPLQQFCPIIPPHAQIHKWPSSALNQAVAVCSSAGRMRRMWPKVIPNSQKADPNLGECPRCGGFSSPAMCANHGFRGGW